MQKRLLLAIALTIFIGSNYTISSESKKIFVAESYRFSDGKKHPPLQKDINRAGVLLLVSLDKNNSNVFENYGIIVGFDKNLKVWMLGQAGKCDHDDVSTAVTASRELEEETGGYYRLSSEQINKLPYLSAAQKQMFIYKSDDLELPSKIKHAVKKAQLNVHFSQSYKEINDIEVVSLQELFNLAQKIDAGQVRKNQYFVTTTTGKEIRLEKFYAQILAHPCDHNRLKYARRMFDMICR